MATVLLAGLAAAASTAIPLVISGGLGALFTTSALSTILTAFVGGALSAIAGGALSGSSGNDIQPSLLVRQPVQYGQFVYGRTRVTRTGVTFAENDGGDLWLVVPVACHEINRFVEIFDGDERMWTEGVGTRGEYNDGRLNVYTRTGSDSQAHVPELIAAITRLDSNFRGRGIAYIVLHLVDFAERWNNTPPQLWVEVEGAKVYDPRTSTWVYTANAPLCINHYMTATRGGPGLTRINEAAVIAAANMADEWVADEGSFVAGGYNVWDSQTVDSVQYHRRYEINGSFSSDLEPVQILAEMEPYIAGHVIWAGGEYHINPGAWVAPVASYTEANVVDVPVFNGNVRIEDQVHGVRGRFSDPSARYQIGDFPELAFAVSVPPTDAANYFDADLTREIHPERATRLAVLAARQFFRYTAASLAFPLAAMAHQAGDRIDFEMTSMGVDKSWEVREVRLDLNPENPAVRLDCIEDNSTIWDWTSATAAAAPPTPGSTLPSSALTVAPATVTCANASYMGPDGITVGGILVTFPASTGFNVVDYTVEWYEGANLVGSARTGGALRHTIFGLEIGTEYDVYVIATNVRGRKSTVNPTQAFTVVGDIIAPAVPTGWAGEAGFAQITLHGPVSASVDFKHFNVYGGEAAGSPVFLFSHAGNEIVRHVTDSDIYVRYKVTAEDFAGNESAVGSSAWIDVVPLAIDVQDAVDAAADAEAAQAAAEAAQTLSEAAQTAAEAAEADAIAAALAATQTAASLLPIGFQDDGTYWSETIWGDPDTLADLNAAWVSFADTSEGRVAVVDVDNNGSYKQISAKGVVPVQPDRTYRITVVGRHVGGVTPITPAFDIYFRRMDGTYTSTASTGTAQTISADGWQTYTRDWSPGSSPTDAYFRPNFRIHSGWQDVGVTFELLSMRVEDITESTAAAASAVAASTSESNASASEAAAATSETNATGSASSAATSATVAATSESNADDAAAAAAVSETNAAGSETNAAGSAAAALATKTATALLLGGGACDNPVFEDWTGADTDPPDDWVVALGNGTLTKVAGKYGNAVQLATETSVDEARPLFSQIIDTGKMPPAHEVTRALLTVELELVAGDWDGFRLYVQWRGTSNANHVQYFDTGQLTTAIGVVQKLEVFFDQPGAYVQDTSHDDLKVFVQTVSVGSEGYSDKTINVHRVDVQDASDWTVASIVQATKIEQDGFAAAHVGIKAATSGGNISEIKLTTWDDPDGSGGSAIQMNADDVIVSGTITAAAALIADAAVDTLQIKGNGVTIPVAETLTSVLSGDGTWQTAHDLDITFDQAGQLLVIWSGEHNYVSGGRAHDVRMKVDGVIVAERGGAAISDYPVLTWSGAVTAKTVTVLIEWNGASSSGSDEIKLEDRTLALMGAMR